MQKEKPYSYPYLRSPVVVPSSDIVTSSFAILIDQGHLRPLTSLSITAQQNLKSSLPIPTGAPGTVRFSQFDATGTVRPLPPSLWFSHLAYHEPSPSHFISFYLTLPDKDTYLINRATPLALANPLPRPSVSM